MHAFNAFFFAAHNVQAYILRYTKEDNNNNKKRPTFFFYFISIQRCMWKKKMKIIVALPNAQIPSLSPLLSRLHFVRIFGTHKISTIDLFQCG